MLTSIHESISHLISLYIHHSLSIKQESAQIFEYHIWIESNFHFCHFIFLSHYTHTHIYIYIYIYISRDVRISYLNYTDLFELVFLFCFNLVVFVHLLSKIEYGITSFLCSYDQVLGVSPDTFLQVPAEFKNVLRISR